MRFLETRRLLQSYRIGMNGFCLFLEFVLIWLMVLIIGVTILDELPSELVHTLSVLAQLPSSFGSHQLRLRVNLRRVEFFLTLLEHPALPYHESLHSDTCYSCWRVLSTQLQRCHNCLFSYHTFLRLSVPVYSYYYKGAITAELLGLHSIIII